MATNVALLLLARAGDRLFRGILLLSVFCRQGRPGREGTEASCRGPCDVHDPWSRGVFLVGRGEGVMGRYLMAYSAFPPWRPRISTKSKAMHFACCSHLPFYSPLVNRIEDGSYMQNGWMEWWPVILVWKKYFDFSYFWAYAMEIYFLITNHRPLFYSWIIYTKFIKNMHFKIWVGRWKEVIFDERYKSIFARKDDRA